MIYPLLKPLACVFSKVTVLLKLNLYENWNDYLMIFLKLCLFKKISIFYKLSLWIKPSYWGPPEAWWCPGSGNRDLWSQKYLDKDKDDLCWPARLWFITWSCLSSSIVCLLCPVCSTFLGSLQWQTDSRMPELSNWVPCTKADRGNTLWCGVVSIRREICNKLFFYRQHYTY